MNRRVQEMWVRALRSGQYVQGRRSLIRFGSRNEPDCFCVMGVLCDLYAREVGGGFDKRLGVEGFYDAHDAWSSEEPTPAVLRWAGLPDPTPAVLVLREGREMRHGLMTLNDVMGYGFKRLASLVEKQL